MENAVLSAETEDLYRTLVQSSVDGFCIVEMIFDAQGRGSDYVFVAANTAFERHAGFAALPGKSVFELAPLTDRQWVEAFARVARSGQPERLLQRANQTGRWFEVHAFRLGNSHSRVAMQFRDVTSRVRADAERETFNKQMHAERLRLMEILSQAPSFICVAEGPQYVIAMANERYYDLVGRRDIIGKTVMEALPELAGQGVMGVLDAVYTTGEPFTGQEVHVRLARLPDRRMDDRYVDCVYQALRGIDGKVNAILLQGVDQTDRRLAVRALKAADRNKDQFLALLAHELRNPLATIGNAVGLLERAGTAWPSRGENAGGVIRRQVEHMVRLIDDLLDVSRINSGKIELRRRAVELSAIIEQAVEAARPFYYARGNELSVDVPAEPIHLDADPARLAQVIGNLLHNAAKFTPAGGHAWLSVSLEGGEAVIRVRDDGIGIPAGGLSSMFKMFSQLDTSLERSHGGLGIGLALVRTLVEMHGGSVQAASAGRDQGSEFVVRLPALSAAAPAPPSVEQELPSTMTTPESTGATKMRFVAADDNRDAADLLAVLLSMDGHEVHTAYDGIQAYDAAEKHRPDVVLLDLGMPGLNGYDACRRIRAQPWGKEMTLVALTGWGQEEDKRRTQEAGFDAHLVKPVDYAALQAMLAQVRSRQR